MTQIQQVRKEIVEPILINLKGFFAQSRASVHIELYDYSKPVIAEILKELRREGYRAQYIDEEGCIIVEYGKPKKLGVLYEVDFKTRRLIKKVC